MSFSKQDDLLQQQQNAVNNAVNSNQSRYKTELCRSFMESNQNGDSYCRYKDKCQFAHGLKELRTVQRHPKYKTEPCKSYYSLGFCCYGKRCHFIHDELFYQQQTQTQDFFVANNHHQKFGGEDEKLMDYIAAAAVQLTNNHHSSSPTSSYSNSSGSSSPNNNVNNNTLNNLYFGVGGSVIW